MIRKTRRNHPKQKAKITLDRKRPTRKRTDREYMEIAIREMLKSRSEHEDKFDPSVGSVLVDAKGIEIDRAHRRFIQVITENSHFSRKDHEASMPPEAPYTSLSKLFSVPRQRIFHELWQRLPRIQFMGYGDAQLP
jgi:hypothetical protein